LFSSDLLHVGKRAFLSFLFPFFVFFFLCLKLQYSLTSATFLHPVQVLSRKNPTGRRRANCLFSDDFLLFLSRSPKTLHMTPRPRWSQGGLPERDLTFQCAFLKWLFFHGPLGTLFRGKFRDIARSGKQVLLFPLEFYKPPPCVSADFFLSLRGLRSMSGGDLFSFSHWPSKLTTDHATVLDWSLWTPQVGSSHASFFAFFFLPLGQFLIPTLRFLEDGPHCD